MKLYRWFRCWLPRFLKIALQYGPCDRCGKWVNLTRVKTRLVKTVGWAQGPQTVVVRPGDDLQKAIDSIGERGTNTYITEFKGWTCWPCGREILTDDADEKVLLDLFKDIFQDDLTGVEAHEEIKPETR